VDTVGGARCRREDGRGHRDERERRQVEHHERRAPPEWIAEHDEPAEHRHRGGRGGHQGDDRHGAVGLQSALEGEERGGGRDSGGRQPR
jgi:hypothetical protein